MEIKSLDFYCERIDTSFWSEPTNALTNIMILIGGIIGYRLISSLPKSQMRKDALLASYFAIITAIGSFLFHTFANNLTIVLDIGPISLFEITVINFFLLYHFNWKKVSRWIFLIVFVIISIGLDFVLRDILNGSLTYFPSLALILTFGVKLWKREQYKIAKYTLAGFLSFCIALTARSSDMAICESFPLGTHFLWHSVNGLVIYFLLMALYESALFFSLYSDRIQKS